MFSLRLRLTIAPSEEQDLSALPNAYVSHTTLATIAHALSAPALVYLTKPTTVPSINILETPGLFACLKPLSAVGPRSKHAIVDREECVIRVGEAALTAIGPIAESDELLLYPISPHQLPTLSYVRLRLPERGLSADREKQGVDNAWNRAYLPSRFTLDSLLRDVPMKIGQKIPIRLREGTLRESVVVDFDDDQYSQASQHDRKFDDKGKFGLATRNTKIIFVDHTWVRPLVDVDRIRSVMKYLRDCYGDNGERVAQFFSSAFIDFCNVYSEYGIHTPPNKILLTGPSGIGKTYVIRTLCEALGVKMICINAGSLASDFNGDMVRGLREIFKQSKEQATAVVLDHADVLFPNGGDTQALEHELCKAISVLDEIQHRTVIIFTTTTPEHISFRLLRMIPDTIPLEIPTPAQRLCAFRWCTSTADIHLASKGIIEQVSDMCHAYIPGDVQALCAQASENANDADRAEVQMDDFKKAIPNIRVSGLKESLASARKAEGVKWSDVGGLRDVKAFLEESVIWLYKHSAAFERLGLKPSKGILLYGPPGTGKTLLAKAISTESSANFLPVSIPDLIKGEVGESEKAIAHVFQTAVRCSPCIIFLDELEALFGSRESSGGFGQKLISQLLLEMDELESKKYQGVVILAATNFPEVIDPSILRPGRLDRFAYIPPPTVDERGDILRIVTSKMPLAEDVSLSEVAKATENYTGADLKAVGRRAGLATLKRQRIRGTAEQLRISMEDFHEAVRGIVPSLNPELKDRYLRFGAQQHLQRNEDGPYR